LCAKAGLPDGAWRSPEAIVESFTAQVFDEDEMDPARAPN
jgi:AMMECR1 domain-containing protein